jgi:hypothetical protein
MGVVSEIKAAIEEKVELVSGFTQAPFRYDFQKNNKNRSTNIYAVRIGESNSISGTNQTLTQDRTFEVYLSTRFGRNGSDDIAIDNAIISLIDMHELISVQLFRRELVITSARLLVVDAIDISSPEIDNDNDIVSILATYSMKFRLGV